MALLVVLPGELREGLESLLLASDGIAEVLTADDLRTAMVKGEINCPELVVVELAGDALSHLSDLAEMKTRCPDSKYLALAECASQAAQAKSAGADVAVLKGFRAADLSETVSKMLAK